MLLTIFDLIIFIIIISETLLFSNAEVHTFQITAYCNPTFENSTFAMPQPINAEAKALFVICTLGLKIKGVENGMHICTYTLERETPLNIFTDDVKRFCENYSEFDGGTREMNAEIGEASGMNAETGNAEMGEASGMNAETGNAEMGEASGMNAETGNAEMGGTSGMNAETGNAEMGGTSGMNAETGEASGMNAETGEASGMNAEMENAKVGGTSKKNAKGEEEAESKKGENVKKSSG
ncbi:hypothetical protein niasHT_037701 [Heterodera trifolii]|uniref:Effector protein n=1 Tax=Heterodera trifolii TaxID=157864 RepID=A0ABD2IZA8_9BILA